MWEEGVHCTTHKGVVVGGRRHIAVLLQPCFLAWEDCILAVGCVERRETDVLGPLALFDKIGEKLG